MFTNVLVGVDGRMTGRDAIALARQLIATDGRLTLAHVYDGPRSLRMVTAGPHRTAAERSRTLLEDELHQAEIIAELASVSADSPGHGLHQQAEHQGADLLVVGSCTRAPLGRAILGDDTRAALNGVPCAIAIAPAGYAGRHASIARIGVAFNDTPESLTALTVARSLAAEHHSTIHVLDVVSLPSIAAAGYIGVGDAIQDMVDSARLRLDELPDVEGHAVHGLPGEELARFGDDVDLLVVGSRGYGPVRRMIVGSTSNYLVHHARCPLLVLPRSVAESDAPHRDERVAATAV